MLRVTGIFLLWMLTAAVCCHDTYARGIMGNVANSQGEAVAYATIYVAELHHGTTANEHGIYQLALSPGTYKVRFQYLGYETQVHQVVVDDQFVKLDVVMEVQAYSLPVVTVTASGEDPAYYIMRRAISMSQYYLNQVSAYQCLVYLKGTGVLEKIPALMRRQLERQGVEQDKYFVTETISEVSYQIPGQVETHVISTRSSGDDNQTSPMAFVTISLYRDINGIISPLSRNAFQVYRFELEGSFIENGDQINKIRVIPRRAGHDLYSGHIYIREGTWNLHTVNLRVEQSLFSLEIRQVYNNVGKGVWMPVSHDFMIELAVMGLEMRYSYLASVSEYELTLNPHIDHDFYVRLMEQRSDILRMESREAILRSSHDQQTRVTTGTRQERQSQTPRQERIADLMAKEDLSRREVLRLNRMVRREAEANQPRRSLEVRNFSMEIDDSARVQTADYWAEHRPVPLTPEELDSFKETEDGSQADTLSDGTPARRTLRKLMLGGQKALSDDWRVSHTGLITPDAFFYNTVDGLQYNQRINFIRSLPDDRRLRLMTHAGWATARNSLLVSALIDYRYNAFRRAAFGLTTGKLSSDFNTGSGIDWTLNSITTLFYGENPLKLYESAYIRAYHETDIVNGLVLHTSMAYAQRKPLENNSDFYIIHPANKAFISNIPGIPEMEDQLMPEHNAFTVDARLTYTHRHYYMLTGNRKQMLYSHYPGLSVQYREGIKGPGNSDTRFRQLEASVSHSFDIRLVGNFQYRVHAGKFLRNDVLYTPDYKHFNGNETWVMPDDGATRFRTINFYEYSTGTSYAYGHLQYTHGRIILKRLPFLAKTLIREKLFMNILTTPERPTLLELGYGLDQVGLLFNLELVTGFEGGNHHYTGFRIGIPLGGQATVRM